MRFEPRIKVTFFDVSSTVDGPSVTGGVVVSHNQLWVGGKLVASYSGTRSLWRLTHEFRGESVQYWPEFRMEALP
jgi:hypothetical protein